MPPTDSNASAPEPRSVPRPRTRSWHIAWTVPVVLIAFYFVFAMQAHEAAHGYRSMFTLGDAIAAAWDVPLSHLLLRPRFYLLPYALFIHWLGSLLLRRRLTSGQFICISLARTVLSSGLPLTAFFVLFTPLIPVELRGDASKYGLIGGGPMNSPIVWWAIYQVMILLRDTWNRELVHDECAACQYSRTGLAPSVPCPECGLLPTVPSQT